MKKIIFPFLGILMLVFSSCVKGDNSRNIPQTAGVIGFSSTAMQPTIITPYGTFLAPELSSKYYIDIYEGDAVIATFTINYDNQPSGEYYTASSLQYVVVGKDDAYATPGGESRLGDFSTPIMSIEPYSLINYTMFFLFQHTAPADQAFVYELTYATELEEDETIPTIYLRAKEQGTGTKSESTFYYPFAFNMSSFLNTYPKDSQNKVKFFIKYKTGVKEDDGTEIFKDYLNEDTPFEIIFN